jgi:2-polyprenyl-6-methoxyphenol hydroxylase-like FAD-dependent oxidoreductase
MAVEDAAVLAEELESRRDVENSLAAVTASRIDPVQKVSQAIQVGEMAVTAASLPLTHIPSGAVMPRVLDMLEHPPRTMREQYSSPQLSRPRTTGHNRTLLSVRTYAL